MYPEISLRSSAEIRWKYGHDLVGEPISDDQQFTEDVGRRKASNETSSVREMEVEISYTSIKESGA